MGRMITRRSLLRMAAPALVTPSIVIPLSAFRGGGGDGPGQLIQYGVTITQPGTYYLNANINGGLNIKSDWVTILGNGYAITGGPGAITTVGRSDMTNKGIVVRDLTCTNLQVQGNDLTTKTNPPAVTIINCLVNADINGPATPFVAGGSNIYVKGLTQLPGGAASGPTGVDDNMFIWAPYVAGGTFSQTCNWVTYDGCTTGINYDVGIEGIGTWQNCTITNCNINNGGIGAWYGSGHYQSGGNTNFDMNNCTFTNNRVEGMKFQCGSTGGNWLTVDYKTQTDAVANSNWGFLGCSFSGNYWS
jgi:hypothetical protein